MNLSELSSSQLRQAATIKEKIETLQQRLNSLLGTTTAASSAAAGSQKGKDNGKVSPATKAKLSVKLKAYWAKRKAAKTAKVVPAPKAASRTAVATTPAPKKKWRLSAVGLARIKAANKAYWAAKKAAKKK